MENWGGRSTANVLMNVHREWIFLVSFSARRKRDLMKPVSGRLKKKEKKDCLSHIVCLTAGCGGVKILHENKKQLHKSRRGWGVGYGVCGICISDYQRQRPHPCSKSLWVTSCRGLEEYFEKVFLSMLILINNCYCWIFMLLLSCINERALLEVTDLGRLFLA